MKEIIIVKGKEGKFEVKPEFPDHACYFYPIPDSMQGIFKGVDLSKVKVSGKFGKCYDTGKKDKRGKKIYIRYFIPSKIEKGYK